MTGATKHMVGIALPGQRLAFLGAIAWVGALLLLLIGAFVLSVLDQKPAALFLVMVAAVSAILGALVMIRDLARARASAALEFDAMLSTAEAQWAAAGIAPEEIERRRVQIEEHMKWYRPKRP